MKQRKQVKNLPTSILKGDKKDIYTFLQAALKGLFFFCFKKLIAFQNLSFLFVFNKFLELYCKKRIISF